MLTDCVPSKTLIATSERSPRSATRYRVGIGTDPATSRSTSPSSTPGSRRWPRQQSDDIRPGCAAKGVTVLPGARPVRRSSSRPRAHRVEVLDAAGTVVDDRRGRRRAARHRRHAAGAAIPPRPDGERILSWRDVYDLTELPDHLVVVGSGVTGAEFASGYSELGVPVTLVSSRDRVLPGEDPDAAEVIEQVFTARGGTLVKRARAAAVRATGRRRVGRAGRTAGRSRGSHALMCVGSVPERRPGWGSSTSAWRWTTRGYIARRPGVADSGAVDLRRRATAPACCCSPRSPAMQGRIAMWHALGEAVSPLRLKTVAANVFTHPEIATVGIGLAADHLRRGARRARSRCRWPRTPAPRWPGLARRLREDVLPAGDRRR